VVLCSMDISFITPYSCIWMQLKNQATWESAAADLGQASYGGELTRLIGKVYALSAHQFLGATDSGVGMPSIAKWAKVSVVPIIRGFVLQLDTTNKLLLSSRVNARRWNNQRILPKPSVMDSLEV